MHARLELLWADIKRAWERRDRDLINGLIIVGAMVGALVYCFLREVASWSIEG